MRIMDWLIGVMVDAFITWFFVSLLVLVPKFIGWIRGEI